MTYKKILVMIIVLFIGFMLGTFFKINVAKAQTGYTTYGNTTYYDDGTSASQYGNTIYYSNGKSCTQYGGTVYCN